MMTFSQAVERGHELVKRRVDECGGTHAPSALFDRVARKVLRDDGEPNPAKSLLVPLVEALRDRWNSYQITGE